MCVCACVCVCVCVCMYVCACVCMLEMGGRYERCGAHGTRGACYRPLLTCIDQPVYLSLLLLLLPIVVKGRPSFAVPSALPPRATVDQILEVSPAVRVTVLLSPAVRIKEKKRGDEKR